MSDDIKWVWGVVSLPLIWIGRVIWSNHTSLQKLREEIAKDYPTWSDMHKEIHECSNEKDKQIADHKEDLLYIRGKVDNLVEREMNRGER